MDCPTCNHPNRAAARFCGGCGQALPDEVACPQCGTALPRDQDFCDGCGARVGAAAAPGGSAAAGSVGNEVASTAGAASSTAPVSYTPKHLADRILQDRAALEGERKQVTVLFADVKGSMELAEQVDPEQWHKILDGFFRILTDGVHRYEGTVNQYTGDGIMALFGAPIAHEDHARRACLTALYVRDAVRGYANELRLKHGLSFSARMGLNSGEVIVGAIGDDLRMDYTAQGHCVGLAQRMESLAEPGTIYLSEYTADLVRDYADLEDLGKATVKGSRDEIGVFRLKRIDADRTRLDVSRTRGFTKFVGRSKEFEILDRALDDALAGKGAEVAIVAEAGVGKSRLCHEFAKRAEERGAQLVKFGQCAAHGSNVPLMPFTSFFRGYFELGANETIDSARTKITERWNSVDPSMITTERMAYTMETCGYPDPDNPIPSDSAEERRRVLTEIMSNTRAMREQHKMCAVFIWEDMHWIDPASEQALSDIFVMDPSSHSPTLMVYNYRPEYRLPWFKEGYTHKIELGELDRESVHELLLDLIGPELAAGSLADSISERSAGNPFFVEEIVQSLVESGVLVGVRGSYRLVNAAAPIAIPQGVQPILAARIDRLEANAKRVLQSASAIDRTFSLDLLREIAEVPRSQLDDALRTLGHGQFLYETAPYPDVEYTFKHPLTQEVAYGSLLSDRKVALHANIARALARRYGDDAGEKAALIAHHFEMAADAGEAARWHAKAGEWSMPRDLDASLRHWGRCEELAGKGIATDPADIALMKLRLRAIVATSFMRSRFKGFSDRDCDQIESGLRLARELEDIDNEAHLLGMRMVYRLTRGDQEGAVETAYEGVNTAERSGDPQVLLSALCRRVLVNGWHVRDHTEVMRHTGELLELARLHPNVRSFGPSVNPEIFALGFRGLAHLAAGRLKEAQREMAVALEKSRDDPSREVGVWINARLGQAF